jgi:hypothetical protein
MAILSITQGITGLSGVSPSMIFVDTNDTAATVTTAGYLNPTVLVEGIQLNGKTAALVYTTDDHSRWYAVTIANGIITLVA